MELKEATFDLATDIDEETLANHKGEGHSLVLLVENPEMTSRSVGEGRYAKTFYGVSLEVNVNCECGDVVFSTTLNDDCQASQMDELV